MVLVSFRRLKDRKHGDLQISVVNGSLVKIWEVVKHDLRHNIREAV